MALSTVKRYALDPTGANPNNFVSREPHTLNPKATLEEVRVFSPSYGAFFANAVSIWDKNTGRQLQRGVDYRLNELVVDASLTFGQEICQFIVITNGTVANQVEISYQCLGGHYQNDASAVHNIYETFLNDNRAVDWENVGNKPSTFPPSEHLHLLEDIVGFGPVIVAIERMREAILLQNAPAFEALINWVKNRSAEVASELEIREMQQVGKMMSLERLLYSTRHLNFNAITYRPNMRNVRAGDAVQFTLSSTNFHQREDLYWTLRPVATNPDWFPSQGGMVSVINQEAEFSVATINPAAIVESAQLEFQIDLRRNSQNGPIVAESGPLMLQVGRDAMGVLFDLFTTCCWHSVPLKRNQKSRFIILNK